MMDIKAIAEAWKGDQPKYEELGQLVNKFIRSTITECEILPEITFRTKELYSIVKKIKKKLREKEYSYTDLNDKLGIRIICTFQEEMEVIEKFLYKYFEIKKVERKRETLDIHTLDYTSNHYDACIKTSIKQFTKYSTLKNLVFEIQVRTLNQHAWANTAHALSYKQEANIPPNLERKVYRLLSLYEIADDEFSVVNSSLKQLPDNEIYVLLRKLEGKIYKYAQVDFDRELSLNVFRTILGFLEPQNAKLLSLEIENFIKINSDKIQQIFAENEGRFYEIPLLTQPEIFIIWYCLNKFPYSFKDKWEDNFDADELEQIEILWGKQI